MLQVSTVSFPGLGIDNFSLDNVFLNLPFGDGFAIMWYGVLIAIGMICAIGYCYYRCKQYNISGDALYDIAIFAILFGVIGARLFYVFFDWLKNPSHYDSFFDIINIRGGGLAIYGGVIGGALTAMIIAKYIKKINWRTLFDCAGPGVMIAQSIGRWGNFMNGEAYGGIVPSSSPLYFLRMGLVSVNTKIDFGTTEMVYVHPTFLYESIWNLIGFILINIFYKKKKFEGQIALEYFIWYGFGRMFIEGLRTDSLYIGNSGIRISQLLGFLLFAAGTALLVLGLVDAKKKAKAKESAK